MDDFDPVKKLENELMDAVSQSRDAVSQSMDAVSQSMDIMKAAFQKLDMKKYQSVVTAYRTLKDRFEYLCLILDMLNDADANDVDLKKTIYEHWVATSNLVHNSSMILIDCLQEVES